MKSVSDLSGKLADIIFFVIIGSLYAWALSESVLAATVFSLPFIRLFMFCAGFIILLNLAFWGKYTAIGAAGFLLLGTMGALIFLYLRDFEVGWFVALREDIEGLIAFIRNESPYQEGFAQLTGLGLAFLFSLVTVLNTRIRPGFIPLALIAFGVIAVPTQMGLARSDPAILVLLFCLLTLLAKRLYLAAQRGQVGQAGAPARYGLMLLPLCLLLFGVGWALPKPDAETVENLSIPDAASVMDNIVHAFTPDQTMSFTDGGRRLGGPVDLNDLVVMVVESEERLYLAGAVRDYYTGYAWLSTQTGGERLDPDEDGLFRTDPSPENQRDSRAQLLSGLGAPMREISITTMDVRTNAIFTPPFHQTLEIAPPVPIDQNTCGNLRGSRVLPQDALYTQTYIGWDTRSSCFSEVLRGIGGGFDTEGLAPFLQLPYNQPDRVSGLARELTAGAGSNYDKLRILELFLATTFPYTLDAQPLPPGEDFVDHFLFTAREGYCVHYASAMVVMARSLGIPARFVEGFITPERPAGDGRFWVTNRQAHAWVEAYFPGLGWIMFEPTAIYNQNGDGIHYEEQPVYLSTPDLTFDDPDLNMLTPAYDPTTPAPATESTVYDNERGIGFLWVTILVLLGFGGGGYLACHKLTTRYRARQQALESLSNREAVVVFFASTLNAARAGGCPISHSETALVYAGRTHREPVFGGQGVDIRQLADLYSKAAYSEHEITADERASAQNARDRVITRLRAAPKTLPKYFVERYLLLRY